MHFEIGTGPQVQPLSSRPTGLFRLVHHDSDTSQDDGSDHDYNLPGQSDSQKEQAAEKSSFTKKNMFYQSEINYSNWNTIIIVIVARSLNIVILSVIIMIILSSISTSFNMTNTATTVNSNIDISPSAPPPSPSVSSQQSSFLSSPCPTAHFEWTPFP